MDALAIAKRLGVFPLTVRAAAGALLESNARWKPASGDWSVLEIVNHLVDAEAEDFRPRLEMTLADPSAPWPEIDLEAMAAERRYNERRLVESIDRFAAERTRSVSWLRSLRDVDWSATHQHPKLGPICAGDLLHAWAAHDALHLKQIAKRYSGLAERDTEPYSSDYAGGSWS